MAGINQIIQHPEEALQELQELLLQEQVVSSAVDTQVLLRILVDKNIITREEVNKYRDEVRNSPKYKNAIDTIEKQKIAFSYVLMLKIILKNILKQYLKLN